MARTPRPHNPMPESPYEVLALFTMAMVGATLFIMSTGTLIPFMERTLHLGQTQLGLVLSVQLAGSVATTSLCGMLTDRFGDKAVVLWTAWFMGIALLAGAAVQNFSWLLFWLMMYGIGFAAVTPAGSHAIVYFFPKEQRGFAMGIRQCGMPIAGVVGSILLPAVALRFDYQWALATAGIATMITGTLASLLYREPVELEGESVSMRAMIAEMLLIALDARLVLITLTSMAMVCAQVAVMAFLTLTLVHEAGTSIALGITMFTISQIGAIAGRLSWGWMSDRFFRGSRALPLALICVVIAASAIALSMVTPDVPVWALALISLALGYSAVGFFGLVVIGVAEIGGAEHSGSALGVSLTWTFLAAFVAPALFGLIAEVSGYPLAW